MKHLISAALIAIAAPAFAQMPSQMGPAVPAPKGPQAPPLEARQGPAAYLRMAASSDTYERESSKFILQSAVNPDVQRFAQMMITDHANTTAQLMAAAKAASLGNPPNILPKQAGMMRDLRAASASKRERLYVDQQVMAHQEALALHQGYAAQGDNPGLRAVAASAVPIIQGHLNEILRIQAAMGGPMR